MNFGTFLEVAFKEALRKYLKENRREFDGVIHVTHLTQCLRKSYLEIVKSCDVKTDTQPNFNLFAGMSLHIAIESILLEELRSYDMVNDVKNEFEVEYRLDDGRKLLGTIDFVVFTDDTIYVVEFKTTKYDFPLPKNEYARKMLEKYMQQVNSYVYMLEELYDKPCEGYLMFVKRQNGRVYVYTINKNRATFEETLKRAKILYDAIETNIEPIGEPSCFCNLCDFALDCPYRKNNVNWFESE